MPITTRKPNVPDLRPDLVQREFNATAPNKLWVADITYVRTKKALCTPRLSPMRFLDGSWGGRYQIPCAVQALALQALNQAIVCA
ncbi:hypothetical protein QP940_07100 [Corynebacterium pseudodiphtheriticum]|uniref:hypothetical protein n=1 Tax=Corynebacterium pseudodiphtheriticum TaxID=37637 RepID=UPI00254CF619|nr:hypothetical protein [Corynebacterium pseudodiphtheriticum]MDK8478772.1 hypothetical protein [Corynebacterium pseudodiphtheriticum]MDK8584703.1 hypothetical protein [Corynebacterium pseudodiphtheriticum]MDK8614703.1 hypothetical protein [Corynebacterium pseudodiphtheriticum]MDK8738472.1 hypothetical protein [Corynebacterium pseudodiphtheriticum]MDK8745014.1 hypothetical protein [Corynebacterium pseudodiphtheriticum]